jgi:hypothetical protein
LDDPVLMEGMTIKRRWYKENLDKYGPFTKVAYYDGKPAAQILFYPEIVVPYYNEPRKDVVEIFCVYRNLSEAKGAGSKLLRNLIDEARAGIKCLRGEKCRFLVTRPFNTGEGVSLESFYMDNGFVQGEGEMYLELNGSYVPRKHEIYISPEEDRGRAFVFYDMNCEYGWFFAVNVRDIIKEIDYTLDVQLINKWLAPSESMKRGNNTVIVNGIAIQSFWRSPEFQEEIVKALENK